MKKTPSSLIKDTQSIMWSLCIICQEILWIPFLMPLLVFSISQGLDYIIQSTIMFKINPELEQKINTIRQAQPTIDEDTLVDKICAFPNLRIKKEVIVKGVRQYYKSRVKPAKLSSNGNTDHNESLLDKLKKKVKKSQL